MPTLPGSSPIARTWAGGGAARAGSQSSACAWCKNADPVLTAAGLNASRSAVANWRPTHGVDVLIAVSEIRAADLPALRRSYSAAAGIVSGGRVCHFLQTHPGANE